MFTANSDLEISLMKACAEPSHRPQFLRDLLAADIFIVTHDNAEFDVVDGVLQQPAKINVQPWRHDGKDWLPIFSSLQLLERSLTSKANYVRLNVKDFFEFTRGAYVVLNPNCEYGKEFFPEEIASILEAGVSVPLVTEQLAKGTKVLLGQPKQYPTALIKKLSDLFAKRPNVDAAYLAQCFIPGGGSTQLCIGIDATGDQQRVLSDASMVTREVLPAGESPYFMLISRTDSVFSPYFLRETKPFYKLSLWRRLFR